MSLITKPPRQELELPAMNYIMPSKINAWRGAKNPGAKFTRAQLYQMQQAGIDPDTVPTMTVRSIATGRELYIPLGSQAPVYVITCPILKTRPRDGFHFVIAPSGQRKWVHPSGNLKGEKHV